MDERGVCNGVSFSLVCQCVHGCKSTDISALEMSPRRRSSSPHPPIMASTPLLRDVEKGEKRGELNAEGCRPEGGGEVRLSVGAVDKRKRRASTEGFQERLSQNVG